MFFTDYTSTKTLKHLKAPTAKLGSHVTKAAQQQAIAPAIKALVGFVEL
jgi:hypothetical protein